MRTHNTLRRKRSGQAMLLIAGALVALIALVALAVDGGNAYAQRRIAQNAADGASIAGATKMQAFYLQNLYTDAQGNKKVYPMSTIQNQQVAKAIVDSLQASGVGYDAAHGYTAKYLDANGQVYSLAPIVGGTQSVPFASGDADGSPGVQGVAVETVATADTYFARIIGQNHVSAEAKSGAFMVSASALVNANTTTDLSSTPGRLWPITITKDQVNQNGGSTTLYEFGAKGIQGPGNWGALCFNGDNCGNTDIKDWYDHGFNPATGTRIHEDVTGSCGQPSCIGTGHDIKELPLGKDDYNPNSTGVWINAHTGNSTSASCSTLKTAARDNWVVLIPIMDYSNNGNGSNMQYHIINVAAFKITAADCPGNANSITGSFIGWGWDAAQVKFGTDLSKAKKGGGVGVRLGQ